MLTFAWFLILVYTVIVGASVANYYRGEDFAEWLLFFVFICSLVLGVSSLGVLLDRTDFVSTGNKCEEFGYADSTRYEGVWFCVQYVDKEPVMIPVREIAGWDE